MMIGIGWEERVENLAIGLAYLKVKILTEIAPKLYWHNISVKNKKGTINYFKMFPNNFPLH